MDFSELHVAGISGGKDSTLLYCLLFEFYGSNFLPIFADTGNEHPVTLNYVRNMHHFLPGAPEVVFVQMDFAPRLRKKGIEPTGDRFLDMCLFKKLFPSRVKQFCTEWLKLRPMRDYLQENYPDRTWINYTGMRAQESEKRARTRKVYEWNSWFDCEGLNPLFYTTIETVWEELQAYGVPPNPLYSLGFSRVGCYPCIHASKEELALFPDWAWEKIIGWEKVMNQTFFEPSMVPGHYLPNAETVMMWAKTSRGGRQFNLFKSAPVADAPACLSTWAVCE